MRKTTDYCYLAQSLLSVVPCWRRTPCGDACQTPRDKLGWQMAIHAYTFRKFSHLPVH